MKRDPPKDFREFLFTATGDLTSVNELTAIDVYDNVITELDRIRSLVELLECTNTNEFEPTHLGGFSLILKDIHNRMEAILRLWMDQKPPKRPSVKKRRKKKKA